MEARNLEAVRLFSGLSKRELERVAQGADEVAVPAGFELASQGAFAHEFFVIVDGTASVLRNDEPIAELGPGDFFGEIALLETDRRTASVVATSPMALIVMHQREFRQMEHDLPAVADRIRSAIRARLDA